jgi:hypothetical protein
MVWFESAWAKCSSRLQVRVSPYQMTEKQDCPESLTISWWNSRMSVGGKKKEAHLDRIAPATDVISRLLLSGVDLLALGEVDDFVMRSLSDSLTENKFFDDFAVKYCEEDRGQSDIGIIYNKRKISDLQHQNVTGTYGRSSVRVATKLICTVGNAADPFFFFRKPLAQPFAG